MHVLELAGKKRRDKVVNKERWNASWEKDLKNAYKQLPEDLPHFDPVFISYTDQTIYLIPEAQSELIKTPETRDEVFLDLGFDFGHLANNM